MSSPAYVYGLALKSLANKEVDLDSDSLYVALVTSGYTPNQDTDQYWSAVVAHEASGTGYTANGQALSSVVVSYDGPSNTFKLDAADVSWASSTVTARYAVVYDRTPGTDATRPLLAYVDFGSDQATSNGTFSITWDAAGIITETVS